MWAIAVIDHHYYVFCPQHDILSLIQAELTKIGIDLRVAVYEVWMWEDIVWDEPTWGRNGTYDGDPSTHQYGVDGWDFFIYPWRQNPTSYIWLDSLVYSWATPPTGWNIMSWNDTGADHFYQKASTTLDSTTHRRWMGKWQEEVMHNPPVAVMYYADVMTARASYLDGYDNTAWLYDLSQLDINEATFDAVAPTYPYDRKAVGSDTVMWGAGEPIWDFFPLATLTRTEEAVNVLKQGMLYRTSRENMAFPSSGDFTVIPTLAADFPDWYQKPDGRWVASVPLRTGITWTDGVDFNATDVAYTYQSILTPPCKSDAYRDYHFLLDDVVVNSTYRVDFIYAEGMGPDYDFAGYQAHGWALGMLPYHQLGPGYPTNWVVQAYNEDPIPVSRGGDGLEVLGPYVPISYTPDESITFQKRSEYANALGYSPTLPDTFILKIIPDNGERLIALQTLEADFVEHVDAPVPEWEYMQSWSTHRVLPCIYPASHTLWMQHRNTILSNRYVRLAIAHAIPYEQIFNEVLPGVGVATAYPGRTFITPWQEGFHAGIGYEYNITKAQQYMDMWRYSQAGTDYTKGPLGDHDFSGFVEMADYPIWVNNLGKYTSQLPWYPSNPIDPDNDNDGRVLLPDITYWGTHIGTYYPYKDAW